MKISQFKAAAARLFFDMINVDGVIEDNEIIVLEGLGKYQRVDKNGDVVEIPDFTKEANDIIRAGGLRVKYGIDYEDIKDTTQLTTTDAIRLLKKWQEEEEPKINAKSIFRAENVKKDLMAISGCDGSRDIKEAKLLAAISLCLNDRVSPEYRAIPISYRERTLRFATKEIIYLESEYDAQINNDIQLNRNYLQSLMEVYGYDFVYIPDIIDFLKNKAKSSLLAPILMFSKPFYYKDKEKAERFATEIQNVTTSEFTKTLSLAANLDEELPPCLLIKVKTSTIESADKDGKPTKTKYTDFIALPVKGSIVESIRRIPDNILEFTDSIISLISKSSHDKLYCKGIHKTLIDYVIHRSSANLVKRLVFTLRGKERGVNFVGVDGGKIDMSPAEISLYLSYIIFSAYGNGIPKKDLGNKECDRIKNAFQKIYSFTDSDKIVDIFRSLAPQKSAVRNLIKAMSNFVDRDKYNIVDLPKCSRADINTDLIYIRDPYYKTEIQLDDWLHQKDIL